MGRILFYLLVLLLLVGAAFVGYAMIADLPAPSREKTLEVQSDAL